MLSGAEVRTIRLKMGLTLVAMARLLGARGKYPSHWLRNIESGVEGRHLSYAQANLLLAISEGYQPVNEVENAEA